MKLRKKPIRGQFVRLKNGMEVRTLDIVDKYYVKVLLPSGKITAVLKDDVELPIIDSSDYEKYLDTSQVS